MSAPITWRNVNGSGAGEAAQILEGSRQTFNDAFGIFGNVLQQRQASDQAAALQIQEGNKQAFLDALDKAKTPEEIAELQRSGLLNTLREVLTPQNRAAVRGADEARVTSVRQGITAANQFNESQRTTAEAPEIARLKAEIQAGRATPDLISGSNVRDKDPLLAELEKFNRDKVDREHTLKIRLLQDRVLERADAQGELTLAESQRQATEAARQRGFDAQLGNIINAHQTVQRDTRNAIEAGLSSFPGAQQLPRNADGTLRDEQLTSEQRDAIDRHLAGRGLPMLKDLYGDTTIRARAEQALREAGATPADIARMTPVMDSGFNTGARAPVGREADAAARNLRALQAEEQRVNDQFGTITNQGQASELMEAGKKVINEVTNPMTGGRERYNKALSEWLGKGGIEIKDKESGKVLERVLPSPAQLTRVLSQIQTGWFRNTEGDVKSLLEAWAKTSEAQDGAREVIKIRDRNRLLGIDPLGKK